MSSKLIVLRGPSGAGKSSVAKTLHGLGQKTALVEQDYFRRTILKEKEAPNGVNIAFIKRTVLFLLAEGYHVIVEGMFDQGRYASMFQEIIAEHPDNNYFFYFDISLEETIRRHATKPNCHEFGETELRKWYKAKDVLGFIEEYVVAESSTFDETVRRVAYVSGLQSAEVSGTVPVS